MTDHTVKAFDDEIGELRGHIADMGGRAEQAITLAMQALVKRDLELARKVIADDKAIDRLETEVEKLAVRIIALRAPMADDLREVIAALKIAAVLERIGDILAGKRTITADTDLRLCRFFGLSDGWWLRLQADFDTEIAKAALAKTLAKIKPWTGIAEDAVRSH